MVIGLVRIRVSPSVLSRIKYIIKYCVECNEDFLCNIQGLLRMNHTDKRLVPGCLYDITMSLTFVVLSHLLEKLLDRLPLH